MAIDIFGERNSHSDPVTGRRYRRLTHGSGESVHFYYDVSPWSPNEERIVYSRRIENEPGAWIHVVDLETGVDRPIIHVEHFDPHTASKQMWLDDKTVMVPRMADNDFDAVSLVDVDSGNQERHLVPGLVLKINRDRTRAPIVEANGSAIGFVDVDSLRYTRVFEVEQARELSPNRDVIADRPTVLDNPRWSPDGRYMLFVHCTRDIEVTHESRADTEVGVPGYENVIVEAFVYDALADHTEFLKRIAHHPTWHPNSVDVGFVAWNPDTKWQSLRAMTVDSRTERDLFSAEPLPAGHPVFHPLNPSLVMTDSYGGRFGHALVALDLRSQEASVLLSHPIGEEPGSWARPNAQEGVYRRWPRWNAHPVWNSDGSQVLFNDCSSGRSQLTIVATSDLLSRPSSQ